MGETGCGKTRLVKFMCALQVPPGADVTNMILMKVIKTLPHITAWKSVPHAFNP